MSLIVYNGWLLRDFWPRGLAWRPAQVDIAQLTTWQLVPETFEELMRWATVKHFKNIREVSRQNQLLYRHLLSDGECKTAVAMCMYGFVKDLDLRQLGNWNGYIFPSVPLQMMLIIVRDSDGASRALQSLTLHSCGYVDPFEVQCRMYTHIQRLVNTQINGIDPGDRVLPPEAQLNTHRRVFVRPLANQRAGNEPRIAADSDICPIPSDMQTAWALNSPLVVYRVMAESEIVAGNYYDVHKGDFVEVVVTFDIV
ncbi:hypothetical protein NEOLEDRAFT_1152433, partial [Neolentinus lepideus HHB14362 ss-1]